MKDTCSTCRHFAANAKQCRAHPPIAFFVGADSNGMAQSMSTFPNTEGHLSCGEHHPGYTDVMINN